MKKLLLVRHGVTDWNENGRLMGRSDIGVNERGRGQAERVARVLGEDAPDIEAIYSSPQVRTRETAEPLATALGKEVAVENGFDEVWMSEAWMGRTVAELRGDPDLERVIEDPTYRCDAIEPIADVQARAVAAVERLRGEHDGGWVVVVSHGDPLRVIIAYYLALDLTKFRRLACDNGSVSRLSFNRRGVRLEALNFVP